MARLLILNYHRITAGSIQGIDPRFLDFTLDRNTLKAQLNTIRRLEIPVIGLDDFAAITDDRLYIALTFDDGHVSDHELVLPLLRKFGFTAAFFPVADHLGRPGYLSEEHVKELAAAGHLIGSHSCSHRPLTNLSETALHAELTESKALLEVPTGMSIDTFSIPYGRFNRKVLRAIRSAGYASALTTQFGFTKSTASPALTRRRWNIRRTTTQREFEAVLQQRTIALAWKHVLSYLSALPRMLRSS